MWKHVLFVLLTTQSVSAAVLNVTSNAPSQPGVTSCLLAAPCSLDDALRIAESNGENDMITLQEPSGFQPNGRTYRYLPLPSDLNTDITIMRFAGSGVFEGAGYFLSLDIDSQSGNVTLDGITLRNSVATYTKDPALRIDTDGNITLRNCNIRDIQRDPIAGYQRASGALLRSARLVTIEDCTFSRIVPDVLPLVEN